MKGAETPPEALLNAALHLLAARRRGVEELRGRLRKKGFGASEVANCLLWLQERDLLDDTAFSRALVRDRVNFSPRGSFLMKQELLRKGIPAPVVEEALDQVFQEDRVSEVALAEEAARKWIRKQGLKTLEGFLSEEPSRRGDRERARRRLYAFLARRGFRGNRAGLGMEAALDEGRKRLFPEE